MFSYFGDKFMFFGFCCFGFFLVGIILIVGFCEVFIKENYIENERERIGIRIEYFV